MNHDPKFSDAIERIKILGILLTNSKVGYLQMQTVEETEQVVTYNFNAKNGVTVLQVRIGYKEGLMVGAVMCESWPLNADMGVVSEIVMIVKFFRGVIGSNFGEKPIPAYRKKITELCYEKFPVLQLEGARDIWGKIRAKRLDLDTEGKIPNMR